MTRRTVFKFRLYVAADTQNSVQAVANLKAICRSHLGGRYDLEIVDVFKEPKRALAEEIRMTPTLLVLAPLPLRRIVGALSHTHQVLEMLGVATDAA
jgi:circadian clock protein KaiB